MPRRRIPRNVLFAMIVVGACIAAYLIITFLLIWRDWRVGQH
jgi:hypothetical protein